MRKTYSEFCSRHTKALKLYKELYARDKRFQQFIRVSKPLQDPPSASSSALALVDTAARVSICSPSECWSESFHSLGPHSKPVTLSAHFPASLTSASRHVVNDQVAGRHQGLGSKSSVLSVALPTGPPLALSPDPRVVESDPLGGAEAARGTRVHSASDSAHHQVPGAHQPHPAAFPR